MERNPQMTDYEFVKKVIIENGNVKKAEEALKAQGLL
jgi:N-acetylmuramic acid 6-phosphate etherase